MTRNSKTSHAKKHSNDRYMSFSLGKEEYAIPLLSVREVIAMPTVTPIPGAPAHFVGIMNLRGQVISIVDLRKKLGIKPESTDETAVIICDLAPVYIGVVVDAINQVIGPAPEELSDKPDLQAGRSAEHIKAIYRTEDSMVLLIDVAKALGVEDIARAAKPDAA
jgi:purine-binding chemotaxis protein CheW